MKIHTLARIAVFSAGILSFSALAQEAMEEGFKPIFNGKDLSGWDGNPQFWSVKDGVINGQTTAENPTKGNTFLIWRDGQVDDFELRFNFRMMGNWGNSGVQYRSQDFGNWVVGGYQADMEVGETYSGILYEERGKRGIMAERGQQVVWDKDGKKSVTGSTGDSKAIQASIKKEQWNDYRVIVKGNHFIHMINGMTTVDVTDNDPANFIRSGILALQAHAGPPMQVQFKNLRMKRTRLEDRKKIVLVAGTPSHGKGEHEFNAGVYLMHKSLTNVSSVLPVVYKGGWPADPTAFDNADLILSYADGGDGHPFIQGDRLKQIQAAADHGANLAFAHYAVEVPKDRGGQEFLRWIGGYFETYHSVNPTWEADFTAIPDHPIGRGVKPFKINDEWYYSMRFPANLKNVTPILTAVPPDSTRMGKDDAHGGNPYVRNNKGRAEHVAWAYERGDGGRGFGFTGGHFHKNWNNENFRKLFLNALLWTAKAEVPQGGVQSSVTEEDLKQQLDPK